VDRYTIYFNMNASFEHINPPTRRAIKSVLRRAKSANDDNLVDAISMLECVKTSRRWFIFFAFLDHKMALLKCTKESERKEIMNRSYWNAFQEWMSKLPTQPCADAQEMVQSFVDVLHCMATMEAMFTTSLPDPGDCMIHSVENVTAAAAVLENWNPPERIPAFSSMPVCMLQL